MSLFFRRDGYSRITHNDRCPRHPLVQLALAATAGITGAWYVPGSHPYFILAGVLIVTAVLSLIIRVTVRRKRSRSGACLTCAHPCVQRLPGTQMSKDAEPVPLGLPSPPGRPAIEGNAMTWANPELSSGLREYLTRGQGAENRLQGRLEPCLI